MIFSKHPVLRVDLVADSTPQLPGIPGPVTLGIRHREFFPAAADHTYDIWGVDIANVTSANTPILNLANATWTADGATITGTQEEDFEGQTLTLDTLLALIITVTGATVTATVSGTGLLARLPVGTHLLRATLSEWQAAVTFAAPTGTATIALTALYGA